MKNAKTNDLALFPNSVFSRPYFNAEVEWKLSSTEQLALKLLGGLSAKYSSSGVSLRFRRKKGAALLALLATPVGRNRSREEIANMFWGYTGEDGARNSLRQTLFELRHHNPSVPGLLVSADSVALCPVRVIVDVAAFEDAARGQALSSLERAAQLYVGDFLEGFNLREEQFEQWRAREATRLRDVAISVFEHLMNEYQDQNLRAKATEIANRILAIDPLHELAHQTLINIHSAGGRHGFARRHYDECQKTFERELGVKPKIILTAFEKTFSEDCSVPSSAKAGPDTKTSVSSFLGAPAIAIVPFESANSETHLFAKTLMPQLIANLSTGLPIPITDYRPNGVAAVTENLGHPAGAWGARYAVEGRVAKWKETWRANFSLIDTATGRQLLSGKCQDTGRALFDLVDNFAAEIASKIAFHVEAWEQRRALIANQQPLDAWESYQRGMAYFERHSVHTIDLAQNAFKQVLEMEPDNARAIAGLARCVMHSGICLTSRNRQDAYSESLDIGREALALDSRDWLVNSVMGKIYQRNERFDLALEFLRRAQRANPANPEIAIDIGNLISFMGRPKRGIPILARGLAYSVLPATLIARSHLQAKNYWAAQFWAKRSIAANPENTWTYVVQASALGHLGRTEEANMALNECERRQPGRVNFEFGVRPNQYLNPYDHDHVLEGVQKAGWQP